MLNKRSKKKELIDDLTLSHEALTANLNELEIINRWLGGTKSLIDSLNKIHQEHACYMKEHTIIIGDLGCGGGDMLRTISQWAQQNCIKVELIGIDANPFIIEYAIKKSDLFPNLQYKVLNIFSSEFKKIPFDIITINTVCHHFSDSQLIELFSELKEQVKLAIVINDLQRHWISYFGITILTKIFNLSYLAKHDGPLSVLKAFQKKEWKKIFRYAAINFYEIRWRWAFRWEIIIWPKSSSSG